MASNYYRSECFMSNKFGYCPSCTISFVWAFHEPNRLPLCRYNPSSPSTKELDEQSFQNKFGPNGVMHLAEYNIREWLHLEFGIRNTSVNRLEVVL